MAGFDRRLPAGTLLLGLGGSPAALLEGGISVCGVSVFGAVSPAGAAPIRIIHGGLPAAATGAHLSGGSGAVFRALGRHVGDEGAGELRPRWELLDRDVLEQPEHVAIPGGCRRGAAAARLPVFVVAEPDRRGELGNRADEPEVAGALGGARLAGSGAVGEAGGAAGAGIHHVLQHPHHRVGHITGHRPARRFGIDPAAPEQFAIGPIDLIEGGGLHIDPSVVDGGVGGHHLQHRLLIGAEHHGGVFADLAGDAQLAGHTDHPGIAHFLGQPHGGGVDRVGEGTEHRHARACAGDAEALVAIAIAALSGAHGVLRAHAVLDGRRVGEQLEGGTGGSHRLGGAVELALLPVGAAHHRPHQARAGLHRHQRTLQATPAGHLVHNELGPLLPSLVEAGADRETTHFEFFLAEHLGQLLFHPADEPGRRIGVVLRFGRLQGQGRGLGPIQLGIIDEARLPHSPQHDGATLEGQVGIDQRRVHRGGRWQAGDQGGLREGELLGGFREIHPGGIGHAVGAGAEVHEVEVLLEDLLLAELALDLAGEGGLLDLAPEGAVLVEVDGAGQLLGDGASPLLHRTLSQVAHHGADNAHGVHAAVLVEAAIFGGHEGLLDQFWHLAARQPLPRRRSVLEQHGPIRIQHGEGAGAVVATQPPGIGQQEVDAGHKGALAEGRPHP